LLKLQQCSCRTWCGSQCKSLIDTKSANHEWS
jgi:hypothetical protein